jgi:hypothetical protein
MYAGTSSNREADWDVRRLLIGPRAVTEYKLAKIHKTADVAIQIGKRPDWCHWTTTSASESNL